VPGVEGCAISKSIYNKTLGQVQTGVSCLDSGYPTAIGVIASAIVCIATKIRVWFDYVYSAEASKEEFVPGTIFVDF
jgi:hypothetical protein